MASNPITISRRQNWWGRMIAQLSNDLGAWMYVAAVLGLVSVLAFIYLAEASYVARQINQMVELEQRLDVLHEENSALLLRIAKYEDMSRIKTEARAMGLGAAGHVEYVEVVLDDASPAPQSDVIQGVPATGLADGQRSAPGQEETPLAAVGLRLPTSIAQQFQGWISRATAARESE